VRGGGRREGQGTGWGSFLALRIKKEKFAHMPSSMHDHCLYATDYPRWDRRCYVSGRPSACACGQKHYLTKLPSTLAFLFSTTSVTGNID